jgi:hypothetical protein
MQKSNAKSKGVSQLRSQSEVAQRRVRQAEIFFSLRNHGVAELLEGQRSFASVATSSFQPCGLMTFADVMCFEAKISTSSVKGGGWFHCTCRATA